VVTAPETIPQSRPQVLSTQPESPSFPLPSPLQFVNTDEMIYIQAGTYVVGSSQAEIQQVSTKWNAKADMFTDELDKKQVTVPGFYIDAYEVTNAQYYEFVKATRYPPPPHWNDRFYPAGAEAQPVVFVTWEDAAAYAQWAGKRLPTAEEWEIAARGRDGRLFPWGTSYANQQVNLNYAESGLAPVGSSPEDVSDIGVYDLGGNVMEWTMTQYSDKNDFFVVKGGSWVSEPFVARGANKTPSHVEYRLDHLGFRCVKSSEERTVKK
jgi:formylglycine-generating enzyme required for sulfatase activity